MLQLIKSQWWHARARRACAVDSGLKKRQNKTTKAQQQEKKQTNVAGV